MEGIKAYAKIGRRIQAEKAETERYAIPEGRLAVGQVKASEIAERIFLSVHTVNTHRQRIYAKMGVKNVSELIRKATELGII